MLSSDRCPRKDISLVGGPREASYASTNGSVPHLDPLVPSWASLLLDMLFFPFTDHFLSVTFSVSSPSLNPNLQLCSPLFSSFCLVPGFHILTRPGPLLPSYADDSDIYQEPSPTVVSHTQGLPEQGCLDPDLKTKATFHPDHSHSHRHCDFFPELKV